MPENSSVGYEQDLNNIVVEYLDYASYSDTLESFKSECVSKGRPNPQTSGIKSDQKKNEIQRDLLSLFHSGSRREFFLLWNESLPQVTREKDQLCQKLEFYLQIYFAIYYYKYPTPVSEASAKIEEATNAFRTFLETRGSSLSQTTEFLPYYALPFVPNPPAHPSFKELFTDSWVPEVQVRLEKFLAISLRTNANPRLLELYKDGSKDVQLQLSQCQQSLIESERKTTKYMKRYSKLQNDYHNIISITAELVDTLEATFNGTMVTPEYLQSVCARLFSNQAGQSVDFTRPGTAGSVIRKSLVASSMQHMQDSMNGTSKGDPRNSQSISLDATGVVRASIANSRAVPSPPCIKQQDGLQKQPGFGGGADGGMDMPTVVLYPGLDYSLVKEDITYAENRERCLLLQALRWRLTKSVPGEQRDDVVSNYISNDLLACRSTPVIKQPKGQGPTTNGVNSNGVEHESETYRSAIFQLLKSGTMSAQYLARLINGIASIRNGRAYLSESVELLSEMQAAMQSEPKDSLTREMLLGSLQKLSLKPGFGGGADGGMDMPTVVLYPGLDYSLVKEDITYAENRERCLLLQALRWRLTKSVPGEQRDDVVSNYISNDLLACRSTPVIKQPKGQGPTTNGVNSNGVEHESETYRSAIFQLLKSGTMSAQYLARLINGIASIRNGRAYLSESVELLSEMQAAMQSEPKDSLTREMLLGSLQKLSLKRSLQTAMIGSGVVEWLTEELQDFDSLSDYSLEYSVALLMNLCLRTKGKLRCSGFPSKILSALSDLLGHDYHDIRPYINGTLYSILCVPEVKHEAKSMGLEDIMKQYKSNDNPEMNRQIDFIIRQLNSEEKPKDPEDSDDEQEDDDEEEAKGDAMEADLDKDEIVRAAGSELAGEKLLTHKYLSPQAKQSLMPPKSSSSKQKPMDSSEPLMRPTTPSRTHTAKQHGGDNSAIGQQQHERSRPTTSSGRGDLEGVVEGDEMDLPVLREESSDSVKTDVDASEALSRTLGMEDKKVVRTARSQSGVAPSQRAIDKLENVDFNEYSMVFGSRPKIVRTPDVGEGGMSRRTNTTNPMTPKVSSSVPKWTQRPTSGGGGSIPGNNSTSRN
ncbi:lisH domain-containing protein ARMC9-like isoform X2 [Symsagittifera roscoffensis]|uniref:lisH domain-containing protein ARMC9-like isoform X2 n=1 Tax=Symsagittifera roscoffensis TaxID=84072 RepID=UPI00307B13F8